MNTRRLLLAAALATTAALALSACGTTEPATQKTTATSGPISLTDATGTKIKLDGPATRVVGTEWNVVEYLQSLGVAPVGVADVKGYNAWDSTVPVAADTKDIGTRGEPSVDTIAALAPDLIVATTDLTDAAVKQLRKIAPVLEVKSADGSGQIDQMFDNVNLVAKATGTEDKAAELKASFEKTIAADKQKLVDAGLSGTSFAFADGYFYENQVSIRPYTDTSLAGEVGTQLGLKSGWDVKGDADYGLATVDVEALTKLADVPFLYIGNKVDGDDVFTTQLASNAVWKSLPFVKADKVDRLPDGIWMFGGPESMEAYADAVTAALVK